MGATCLKAVARNWRGCWKGMGRMREAIEEYIEQLQQAAVENRKEADKAYEDEENGN